MRSKIDEAFDQIEYLCRRYLPRIAEGGLALMLLALAGFVADERVMLGGLIQAPPYTPLWIYATALIVTCAAHLVGICMPMLHRALARRGVTKDRLIKPMFDELLWRRCCCVIAIAEVGMYAGVVSRARWTAWLFAMPYALVMSAAFIRLGAIRDAGGATTDDSMVVERNNRRGWPPDPVDPLVVEQPPRTAHGRRCGQVGSQDCADPGWGSREVELPQVG